MKRIAKLWPFVLLGLLVWLWNYPAYALRSSVESASGGVVRVLTVQGSVWNGSMQLGLADGPKVLALPDTLKWNVQLSGPKGPGLRVEHPKLLQALHLGIGLGGITLSEGEMRLPAAWLMALGAPFNTIVPDGLIQARWPAWASGEDVSLEVRWVNAQSALASIRPLGEYVITLTGNPGTTVQMKLATARGPLNLEGQGQFRAGQRFEFNGYASTDESSREALTGLLSQMGRLEGDRYRLGVF